MWQPSPGLCAAALSLLCATAPCAQDAERVAPVLGAASNFGQGAQPGVLQAGIALPVVHFRDGLNWNRAEKSPGTYDFSAQRLAYPDALAQAGAQLTVTLNWGNELFDQGNTPQSPEAVAAFAAFALAVADRFPAVEAIEVGNEFNGANFVRGPLKTAGPDGRATAHAAMLVATANAVRAAHPDLRILGGSTHSIAAGYIWKVLDLAGAGAMDAIALHPYTTDSDQFVRQIAVLRRHPLAADLPIEVTEFGEPDADLATGYFLRNYCQFALGGVSHAVWYPLSPRGDGFVPLIETSGQLTEVGRAWEFASSHFAGQPVADVAPDPFTYGCRFGTDYLVLWGATRELTMGAGVEILDAAGQPVATAEGQGLTLSPRDPLVLHRAGGIDLARDVTLADQRVVADSLYQFSYPEAEELQAGGDAFERFARRGNGQELPLVTLPGQEKAGVPWMPYRGFARGAQPRLTAETLLPAMAGNGTPIEIVHRFTAAEQMVVTLTGHVAPGETTKDGLTVAVTLNGEVLLDRAGKERVEISLPDLSLAPGDRLEIAVGPGQSATGDQSGYRFTLVQDD